MEYYDGKKNQFVYDDGGIVRFEYSLLAIYDWEGRWKKPFLKGGLSAIEMIDFYKTMALDPIDERFITEEVMETLSTYVSDSGTATTFTNVQEGQGGSLNGKTHTAEELYALMVMARIPIEFETRNLNRLLTIMRVIGAKNSPPKKMSTADIRRQNADLNAQRKKALQTKG